MPWYDVLPVLRQKKEAEDLSGAQKDMSFYPGGQQDALRHALWTARMAQDYGRVPSQLISGLHEGIGSVVNMFEKDPGEKQRVRDETDMDLFNNMRGAQFGSANKQMPVAELVSALRRQPLAAMPPRQR